MTVNNRFIPVHASMADLVILANEMCRTDPQLKMDRELLEYLLVSHFGFDKTKNIFCEKIDGKKDFAGELTAVSDETLTITMDDDSEVEVPRAAIAQARQANNF